MRAAAQDGLVANHSSIDVIALAAFNYLSVYLGAIMYGLVMSKFLVANRVAKEVAGA